MALGRPCSWKRVFCLSAVLSFLFCCLFLLPNATHRERQASARFFAAWQGPSQRTHPVAAASAPGGVDFGPLFSGARSEPHCEPQQVLLILVTSAPGNAAPRQVIRKTWATQDRRQPYPWQAVFLIGQTTPEGSAWQVQQEQREFRDILVGNYLDTYRNLTLKVMHGLKWALERCRPSYVLKTDDDCFVNTEWLPEFLARRNAIKTGLYAGSLFPREKRQVIRHPSSKWYVSNQDYPPNEYPPYASGVGYILSLDAVRRIMQAAEHVRPIPVEDAYLGILAQRAGLRLQPSARFAKQNARWRLCNYRYLMVIHHLSAREQEAATQSVREARSACRETLEITQWK
ncbi:beta-1,3-galactosyltransferase 5-like [Elgaria multicarinata webbii]|uniref:beta-1,3-galactosyltransferase 5-like n=1 Tax=Elgaria multicarinata webbii TaxID=159646 RepID=UPI002FCD1DFF